MATLWIVDGGGTGNNNRIVVREPGDLSFCEKSNIYGVSTAYHGVSTDDDYMYASYSEFIRKYNRSDLNTLVLESPQLPGLAYQSAIVGDFLYVVAGRYLRKVRKSDLVVVTSYYFGGSSFPYGCSSDGSYVYACGSLLIPGTSSYRQTVQKFDLD